MHIDVCNGDADGLCAVVQWRLHDPQIARFITGLKRDIELLKRVEAVHGDQVLVCDISMQRNMQPLMRLLDAGVGVRYFDHHKVDRIPKHRLLEAHIDVTSRTCTSLLVDQHVHGRFRAWALVGAFGDNLAPVATRLAEDMGLSSSDSLRLKSLGESINYNAYGDSEQDVWISPPHLYDRLVRYADPLKFLEHETVGQELQGRRAHDMQLAQTLAPYRQGPQTSVYLFPDAAWSRRVLGSMGNCLACSHPQRAHALIRPSGTGDFVVSVRAPLLAPIGAAEFCRAFGGDGRAAAAGIDHLPADQLDPLITAFSNVQWAQPPISPGDQRGYA